MNARDLVAKLRGTWRKSYGEAKCPAHNDREPSLSIRDARGGKVLVHCHAGCDQGRVIAALRSRGLWRAIGPGESCTPAPAPGALSPEQQRNRDYAIELWREAVPIAETLAETYLRARGITGPLPPTLRYHRSLKHGPTGVFFPALVAAVTGNDHKVIAIHRTFLLPDGRGKAHVGKPKLALGTLGTGAVRLAPAKSRIGLAEGIETALSAMQLFDVPTWATLGAQRMDDIAIPRVVERIILFGDRGEAGEVAAHKAGEHFAELGYHVEGKFPPEGFGDWNDALRQRRTAA
jgi:putative DNA primase/helicase